MRPDPGSTQPGTGRRGALAAVLFDMDGTLVATEELWHVAEIRTMEAFGDTWTSADSELSRGGPFDRVVHYMAERLSADSGDVARVLVTEIEHLMHNSELPWMEGARELHAACRTAGVPVGLVSNSWRVLVDAVLGEIGIKFDVVVAGDEVASPKPDPEPYLHACLLLGVDPADAIAIEDSLTGLTSAHRAGCATIAVSPVEAVRANAPGLVRDSLASVSVGELAEIIQSR